MRRAARLVAGLALVLTGTLTGSVLASAGAASVPLPSQDPFYAVPANIANYSNGQVIASRQVTDLAYVLPVPATAWQLKYRTEDSHGTPTATVTTVLVPDLPWLGKGSRPLVSYQTAEDGVAGKCAPSYALRAGIAGAQNNSEFESGLVLLALANGWALSVPDYEGPQSQFLAGPMEAHAVLDGVRAATRFTPDHLTASTPVGMWGYSGGAFATSVAAQTQKAYAPELNVKAIALGGVVANIRATIEDFSGSVLGGAIAMGVNGPMRAYPEANLGQYLSATGRADVAAASGDCMTDASGRFPFLSIADIEAYPGAFSSAPVTSLLWNNSPLGIAGTPTAPVYDYHATFDEFAPVAADRTLMRRYCAAGVPVQHVEDLIAEHISETVSGAPGALSFLARRFAGAAPTNSCATIPTN